MKVRIEVKFKNGILQEAAEKLGSQKALAEYLGVTNFCISAWLNFKRVPDFTASAYQEKYFDIENKLQELTGHSLEEIFPLEIRNRAFLRREKKFTQMLEMAPEQLVSIGAQPALPPAPDELLFEEDRQKVIDEVIETLTPREQRIIKGRYGLEGEERTVRQLAEIEGLSGARIQQIECRILRKLRHPSRSRKLKQLYIR